MHIKKSNGGSWHWYCSYCGLRHIGIAFAESKKTGIKIQIENWLATRPAYNPDQKVLCQNCMDDREVEIYKIGEDNIPYCPACKSKAMAERTS